MFRKHHQTFTMWCHSVLHCTMTQQVIRGQRYAICSWGPSLFYRVWYHGNMQMTTNWNYWLAALLLFYCLFSISPVAVDMVMARLGSLHLTWKSCQLNHWRYRYHDHRFFIIMFSVVFIYHKEYPPANVSLKKKIPNIISIPQSDSRSGSSPF